MYKLQLLMLYLAKLYVNFSLRNSSVYVVCGIRRSGNHALISWLIDALENRNNVNMKPKRNAWVSESGETVHLNEVNFFSVFHFIDTIRGSKDIIKKSKYVIITLEDYIPKKVDPLIPEYATKIKVSRSLLNVISSRLKRLNDQAKIGLDRGDMSIDTNLLLYSEWAYEEPKDDWIKWVYERWLSEPEYRKGFLEDLALSHDSKTLPSTNFGGGSSFSNIELGVPQNNPLRRWEQIEIPDRVISLLHSKGLSLLDAEEREYIIEEYEKRELG
ncbi:hypothetical protein [Marinobacter sp.]|uniref:hypothetical protein n=1 Tax=Marinobacter sp. TaxID=50741 RepID=UPI003A8D71D9